MPRWVSRYMLAALLVVLAPASQSFAQEQAQSAVPPNARYQGIDPQGHFKAIIPAPLRSLGHQKISKDGRLWATSHRRFASFGNEISLVFGVLEFTNQLAINMQILDADPLGVLMEDDAEAFLAAMGKTFNITDIQTFRAFGTRAAQIKARSLVEDDPRPHLIMYVVPYPDSMVVTFMGAATPELLQGSEAQDFNRSFEAFEQPR
ncbi:MAG: hypothetical protein KI792_14330 [Alphaproteobacteria bacterium]|nr:hypothetical protein [Alphaproteobacteria bacterium SS10]